MPVFSDNNKVYAASGINVTFNANGGKIGTKTTKVIKVTKGKKVGKLPAAKRSGYSFKGWYTAKSGGKKISTSTKILKRITYYAQWKKKMSADEKNLIGSWAHLYRYNMNGMSGSSCRAYATIYNFYDDGTFMRFHTSMSGSIVGGLPMFISGFETYLKGNFSVSGNTLKFTKVKACSTTLTANDGKKWRAIGTSAGAAASLKQVPVGGYSSTSMTSEKIGFIDTSLITIGDDVNNDKSNQYKKNWKE